MRGKLLAIMNLLFFGALFVTFLVVNFLVAQPPLVESPQPFPEVFGGDFFAIAAFIFLFNLFASSILVVTLPGLILFPLSAVMLVYRAMIWGELVFYLPTWLFLMVLPTLLLEGEAYAFAALGGAVVGASWLRSELVYKGRGFSRKESFGHAFRECLNFYVVVVVLLFVAAIVETATLMALH